MNTFAIGQQVKLVLPAVPMFAEKDAIGEVDSIRDDGLYNVNFGDDIGYIVCGLAADELVAVSPPTGSA